MMIPHFPSLPVAMLNVIKRQKFKNLMFQDSENEEKVDFGGKGLRQENSSTTEQYLASSFVYVLLSHATGTPPHI